MEEKIKFIAKYGILKWNMFGQKTNKIDKVINVPTIITFTENELIIKLKGIDRNNGLGPQNEMNVFLYENIDKIEIDEGLGSFDIIMKPNTYQEINRTRYLAKTNNVFLIDKRFLKDFYILLKKIQKFGFSDLEDLN